MMVAAVKAESMRTPRITDLAVTFHLQPAGTQKRTDDEPGFFGHLRGVYHMGSRDATKRNRP